MAKGAPGVRRSASDWAALDEEFVGEVLEPHLKFEMPRVLPLDEGIGAHVVAEARDEFVGVETRLSSANIVDRQDVLRVGSLRHECHSLMLG